MKKKLAFILVIILFLFLFKGINIAQNEKITKVENIEEVINEDFSMDAYNMLLDDSMNNQKDNDQKHKQFIGWMISIGIIAGTMIIILVTHIFLFYIFNIWIIVDGKPVRAFKFGKKNEKIRLLKKTYVFVYRECNQIYNKKEDILKINE